MRATLPLILLAMLTGMASAACAAPVRSATTATYHVSYRAVNDVYCIRFFADGQVADPRPGRPSASCRSRRAWAKVGVTIHDAVRDGRASD